jgi:hypothetical protein
MTLNQLLAAFAKAGHPVTVGFDDGADGHRSYPYELYIGNADILSILEDYIGEIESHLLSYAEGPGGSFSFTFDKDLKSEDEVSTFNSFEIMDGDHEIYFHVDQYNLPKSPKLTYEDFPESLEVDKRKEDIILDLSEKDFKPQVIKLLTKLIKKELENIDYYNAIFYSESYNDEDDFQYEYMVDTFIHAYDIVKADNFDFFKNIEIELDSKLKSDLCSKTGITSTELNKIIDTIEEE